MKRLSKPTLLAIALAGVVLPSVSYAQLGHPPSAACNSSTTPLPTQVVIYADAHYGGACRVLGLGNYGIAGGDGQWGHFGLPNDSISSVKVGADVTLSAFSAGEFRGYTHESTEEPFWIRRYDAGSNYAYVGDDENDQFSGLRVIDKNTNCNANPPAGGVTIFMHGHFGGQCAILPRGSYPDWNAMGLPSDSISSFKANQVTVQFFDHTWYGGFFYTFFNTNEAVVPANDTWSSIDVR